MIRVSEYSCRIYLNFIEKPRTNDCATIEERSKIGEEVTNEYQSLVVIKVLAISS